MLVAKIKPILESLSKILLITLFSISYSSAFSYSQAQCLAFSIQYEAKHSCKNAEYSIVNVVQSRVNNPNFPNTICKVVFQKSTRPNGTQYCEFSFNRIINGVCVPKKRKLNKSILMLSKLVYNIRLRDYTDGALFYHATYISRKKSSWFRKHLKPTKYICGHIFYK